MQRYEWLFCLKRTGKDTVKTHLYCSWLIRIKNGKQKYFRSAICHKNSFNESERKRTFNLKKQYMKEDYYSEGKANNVLYYYYYFTLPLSSKQRQNIFWPWFINGSAIRWSRGRIAPESLPQFFYQAELKIYYHIQYCLRK